MNSVWIGWNLSSGEQKRSEQKLFEKCSLIVGNAQTLAGMAGVLAAFAFTATFFTFGILESLLYGEIVLVANSLGCVFFIFGALGYGEAANYAGTSYNGRITEQGITHAREQMKQGHVFCVLGFVSIIVGLWILVCEMLSYTGLFVIAVTILCFIYWYRRKKLAR